MSHGSAATSVRDPPSESARDEKSARPAAIAERIQLALGGNEPQIESVTVLLVAVGTATTRDGDVVGAQKQADTMLREAKRLSPIRR